MHTALGDLISGTGDPGKARSWWLGTRKAVLPMGVKVAAKGIPHPRHLHTTEATEKGTQGLMWYPAGKHDKHIRSYW